MRTALFATLFAAGTLAAGAAPALAAKHHTTGATVGTVTITAKSANAGVGFTWGDGVLVYHGVSHHFTVNGANIVAVGYSEVVGHGRVSKLKSLEDFTGTYAAGTGEATVGHGTSGEVLTNDKGVEIHIDNVTKGAQLAASASGIRLELKD